MAFSLWSNFWMAPYCKAFTKSQESYKRYLIVSYNIFFRYGFPCFVVKRYAVEFIKSLFSLLLQCVISIKRLDAVYIFLKDWEKQVLVAWIINRNLQTFDVFIKTYNAIKGTIALFTHRPFNVFRLQNCS